MVDWWAELGQSTRGDPVRAAALVQSAYGAGFTTVKIPLVNPDTLFRPGSVADKAIAHNRRMYLCRADVAYAARVARANDLNVAISVCDVQDVAFAASHADTIKIGSYELTHTELIKACAATGRDLVISTGMASTKDMTVARAIAPDARFLHCVSAYPCPPWDANLPRIGEENLDGYSDHTRCPDVIDDAVSRWGVDIVELHLDLPDLRGGESRKGHVWTPAQAQQVILEWATCPEVNEAAERQWRADPSDGMRPCR